MRRLLLVALASPAGGACLAALLAALTACGPAVRGNGWNVLLITLETTRADHLGAYGYSRATSPGFDALARRGVLFEHASTVSPRTNPSLASTMTSLYPHEHGVRNLLLPLEPENRTLAEVFREAGYVTAAVQTHPRLVAGSGFAQGFATYDDDVRSHPLATQACAAAAERIRTMSRGGRPWFLWLHIMDPHWTYDPPPPWRMLFGPEDSRPAALYRTLAEDRAPIGPVIFQNRMAPDEVASFVSLYDAEIRFTDEAVSSLLDALGNLGLDARTAVAITADHGESLGEHDYFFEHGDFGTEAEVHVPLLIVAPGKLPSGRRFAGTVRSIDLAPTLLDLTGVSAERQYRGSSLVSVLRADAGTVDLPCFGETDDALHEENTRREVKGIAGKWRWLREGRFKVFHIPRASGRFDRPLYDLETDPGETRNVRDEQPDVAARLDRALDAWIREDRMEEREYHIGPEARELLRSLGYVN